MSWPLILLIAYVAGFFLVCAAVHNMGRKERTAHGQAIIYLFGSVIALIWPLALLYVSLMLPAVGIGWLIRSVRGWFV